MKYNISINQYSVMKNESLRNLDLTDLVLFDFVYHFICADFSDKRTMVHNGVVYTQIKQKLVEVEMPLLNIGTSRTFINRMNKLIDAGLIKRYPNNQKEGVSYFTKGDNFSIMVFSEPTKTNSHPTKVDVETCEKGFTRPAKKDSHNNSIYSNTDIINRVYNTYPAKCPIRGAVVRSASDKNKIAKALLTHSEAELIAIVKRYVDECSTTNTYMKAQSTFYNNLPDYGDIVGVDEIKTNVKSEYQ